MLNFRNLVVGGLLALCASMGLRVVWAQQNQSKVNDEAVNRTRETVKMLDDIYKTTVVLITDKYVHDEDDFPAGSAAIALFEAINKKGWHTVRLLDVTGQPYDAKNVAKDDFEKRAVEKIRKGESYVEEVSTGEKGRELLAMTAVPVVLEKCVLCHPHYKDVPEGEAIGVISYRLPIR